MRIEVGAYLAGYKSDSIASDPDMTELIIDSVYVERKIEIEPDFADSEPEIEEDSIDVVEVEVDPLDSLSTEISADTVQFEIIRELQLKHTYHNDRTDLEAEAIKQYLVGRGVSEDRIETEGYIQQARTSQSNDEPEEVQRWIEIEILQL